MLLCPGSRCTSWAGIPGPSDQFVVCHMVDDLSQCLAAVPLWVLDLLADGAERLADPGHFDWGKMPVRVSRDVTRLEIGFTMTGGAAHADSAEPILAADDKGPMRMAIVILQRAVAGGMTVQAARMLDHFARLFEDCDGPRALVGDRGKILARFQRSPLAGLAGTGKNNSSQGRKNRKPNQTPHRHAPNSPASDPSPFQDG